MLVLLHAGAARKGTVDFFPHEQVIVKLEKRHYAPTWKLRLQSAVALLVRVIFFSASSRVGVRCLTRLLC